MATVSSNTNLPTNYEFNYNSVEETSSNNIATAMVINPNINYHYVNTNKDKDSSDQSNSSSSYITQPENINIESFDLNNVNNITQNLNNLAVVGGNSIDKSFNFFGSNLVGSSNIGYSASLVSSAQHNANLENKCLRCNNQVYSLERIGPIKGNVYHKTCFKCLTCERQLDLKTFYTNQIDLNDRQIYCQSHAPKSGKGSFGADNVHIQNVLNAPKLDLMHRHDNKYKALIDGNSRHILHAINAQHLMKGNRRDPNQGHCYPAYPHLSEEGKKAREKIRKAQEILEAKQRAEEDKLLQKFRDERAQEEKKLESEVKEEWEKRLQALQTKYDQDLKNKRDQMEQKGLTQKLIKEKTDLEKNMTIKREKKRDDAKRTLIQSEQEATAELVTKHSGEMIKLVKAKEQEVMKNSENNDKRESRKDSSTESQKSMSPSQSLMAPPAQPPVRRKRDLYDDPSVFEFIDQQAINVAESEQTSYTELVDQLTEGLVTDLEKARAIFRWITVKDLNAIEFNDSLNPDTPLGLLRGIKFGTETYHTLFMRLCSYAGMHCVDIKGHSKSVGYEPGMKIQPGKFTNTWNAVLIDGEWRFVQCNWGARHLVMSKDKKLEPAVTKPSRDKIKYQYDEHYFLPDPEEFILEFFPHNSEWQLLEQSINLDEFESLPFVRSLFFHYHLDFVNQRQAVITTSPRGACDIKLRMPEDLKTRLAFHFHLRLANKEDNEINGVKLERFVLHTIQDDLVSFNVHVPQTGDYFIEIFASLVEPDANPFGQSFKLKCVCKYKISCEELTQRMHPLPSCASGEWGPMKAMRHFNINPLNYKIAIIETEESRFEVKFDLPKALKIHGKLHSNTQSDLDRFVKHEFSQTNPLQLTAFITLPEEGQYGLDIYARDPDFQSEKRTMSHCCKYLINFNRRTANQVENKKQGNSPRQQQEQQKVNTKPSVLSNPQIQLIGPNTEFLQTLGMVPITYIEPVIKFASEDTPKCDLQFNMSKAVDFSFDLKYDPNSLPLATACFVQMKASEHVKVKQFGYTISFTVTLPNNKLGNYLFTIYASDDQNKTKNLPPVYTYLMKYERRTKK